MRRAIYRYATYFTQPSNVGDSRGWWKSRAVKPSGDIQEITSRSKQTMHGGGLKHSFHALLSDCWTGSSWPPATLHSHPHLSRALPKVEERALSADRYRMVQVHGDAMGDMDEKWWKPKKCVSLPVFRRYLRLLSKIAAKRKHFHWSPDINSTLAHNRTAAEGAQTDIEGICPCLRHRLDDALNWKRRKRNENAGNYIRFHVDQGLYSLSILSKHQLLHSLPGGWRAKMRNAVNLKGGSFWNVQTLPPLAIACFPEASDYKDEGCPVWTLSPGMFYDSIIWDHLPSSILFSAV